MMSEAGWYQEERALDDLYAAEKAAAWDAALAEWAEADERDALIAANGMLSRALDKMHDEIARAEHLDVEQIDRLLELNKQLMAVFEQATDELIAAVF